jgi:hypothetical protein
MTLCASSVALPGLRLGARPFHPIADFYSARGSRGTLVGSRRAVGLINATQRVSSGARRAVAIMDWPQYGSHTHTSISWLTMAFATA